MNKITQSIVRVFKGALNAWKRHPVSIGCAVAFAIVAMIRIQLDWQQQAPYVFLFNCLHWSLALGTVFSLAAGTFAVSRIGGRKAFVLANTSGALAAVVSFALLYLFSRTYTAGSAYAAISAAAQIRVAGLIFVSLSLFVLYARYQQGRFEFDRSLFMTQKAFFLAVLYGLVLFIGVSGVASAVEFLIYSELSEKVFLYIGTLSVLIGYMIFVGYFPDFTIDAEDPRRETAQRQPRFIEILFSYILVPVVLALTLVLLIWAVRTVITGMQVRFLQLYSITAAYTVGGLWLHAMTTRSESGLAKAYRAVYPLASAVILVFEGWAVVSRLISTGLKGTEYIFIMLGLLALAGILFLLSKKEKAHHYIALTACALMLLFIMPGVGYKALPVSAQTNRLEKLLSAQGMFEGGAITPAAEEPEEAVRLAITDAVYYLLDEKEAKLPTWFDESGIDEQSFDSVFGFSQVWYALEDGSTRYDGYRGVYLTREAKAIPVGDYDWAVAFRGHADISTPVEFKGKNGEYAVSFGTAEDANPPVLRISLDGIPVVEESLGGFFEDMTTRYGTNASNETVGSLEEMSVTYETDYFKALLILDYADFSFNQSDGSIYYWVEPHALYLKEK